MRTDRICRRQIAVAALVVLTVAVQGAPRKNRSAPAAAQPTAAQTAPAAVNRPYDSLAGNLPAVVTARNSPYLVVADIYVPQGKRVTVESGVVFLFQGFTSLHIMGTLSAKGAKESPIVFTSVNDKEYNKRSTVDAAPFDWNGVYIHEDGIGTEMSFCAVLYSVEGINSSTKFIRLSPCLFLHNGRTNLVIEGVEHRVTTAPYEYSLTVGDPKLQGVPVNILKDPRAPVRNIMRYSGIGLAAAGCVMTILFARRYSVTSDDLTGLSSTSSDNLTVHTSTEWQDAKSSRDGNLGGLLAGVGVLIVGGAGLTVSFTF